MIDLLKQRLKSKTYWAAVIGALLSILDQQSGLLSQFVPAEYRQYLIMFWPIVMITLREVTSTALADK